MCGIYGKLSSHQIDASIAETATDRLVHRASNDSVEPMSPTESRMTKHRPTLLIDVPRLVSYLAFLREICGAVVVRGVEVHVACYPAALGDEEVAGAVGDVELHHIKFPRAMSPPAHLRAARALNQLVELLRPDIVVHAHFSVAIFTTSLARKSRWPVAHATFHEVSFLAMRGWKAALLRKTRWAARRFHPTLLLPAAAPC